MGEPGNIQLKQGEGDYTGFQKHVPILFPKDGRPHLPVVLKINGERIHLFCNARRTGTTRLVLTPDDSIFFDPFENEKFAGFGTPAWNGFRESLENY